MATHQDHSNEFDGVLWFFTKADAPKVDEVEQDQHVNLSYASPEKSKYVSVSGTAMLVRDKVKAKELWDPKYKAWFPKGLDDPELALLRVDVDQGRILGHPVEPVAHAIGLVKALATGKSYEPGDHEKVTSERPASAIPRDGRGPNGRIRHPARRDPATMPVRDSIHRPTARAPAVNRR